MAHVEKKRKTRPPAGYGRTHEMFEDGVARRAERAEREGETLFEMGGTLFVKIEGGGFVEWVRADPGKIVWKVR